MQADNKILDDDWVNENSRFIFELKKQRAAYHYKLKYPIYLLVFLGASSIVLGWFVDVPLAILYLISAGAATRFPFSALMVPTIQLIIYSFVILWRVLYLNEMDFRLGHLLVFIFVLILLIGVWNAFHFWKLTKELKKME